MTAPYFACITWNDAADYTETWIHEDEIDDTEVKVKTYGFILKKTARYYHVIGDVIVAGGEKKTTFGRATKVPIGMVEGVEEISGIPFPEIGPKPKDD